MIKIFEFLYYCLYRAFALVKRVGEKDENLASWFYSLLLSTNMIMVTFPLKFIIPKGYFDPPPLKWILKIAFACIFIGWYFICKIYFLKKENYKIIINTLELKYENQNVKMAVIGILYSLITFVSFLTSAVCLSKIHWHL